MAGDSHPDLSSDELNRLRHLAARDQTQAREDEPPKGYSAFGWFDSDMMKGAPALALVGRAICLVDYLTTKALDDGESTAWIAYGLAEMAKQAAKTGDWEGFGVLLTGLETEIDSDARKEWPLAEMRESSSRDE